MLSPRARCWTPLQKWLIAMAIIIAIAGFGAVVYGYERYHRGPSEAALFGTWQDMTPSIDSVTYYQLNSDGTFDLIGDSMGELFIVTTGKWYAGGPNIYWRFPAEFVGMRPYVWHIDDISRNEVRVRSSRGGAISVWKRVDLPKQPKHLTSR